MGSNIMKKTIAFELAQKTAKYIKEGEDTRAKLPKAAYKSKPVPPKKNDY